MNRIIFLWAHPRSMSTAIERVMRERGDFDCLHEPFLHFYYLQRSDRAFPHFDSDESFPDSYAGTRDLILEKAETKPVFAKDMSYYVLPEMYEDVEFCRRIEHCFLIRHPLRSILSYYKLDAAVSRYEIGLEAQWQHYSRLLDIGIVPGPVLEAELVQADSAGMMRAFWNSLGLEFREQALSWEEGALPEDWQHVEAWHQGVNQSGGIRSASGEDQTRVEREFEQLCQEAPQLQDYLEHHLPFYRHLRQCSLKPRPHQLEL